MLLRSAFRRCAFACVNASKVSCRNEALHNVHLGRVRAKHRILLASKTAAVLATPPTPLATDALSPGTLPYTAPAVVDHREIVVQKPPAASHRSNRLVGRCRCGQPRCQRSRPTTAACRPDRCPLPPPFLASVSPAAAAPAPTRRRSLQCPQRRCCRASLPTASRDCRLPRLADEAPDPPGGRAAPPLIAPRPPLTCCHTTPRASPEPRHEGDAAVLAKCLGPWCRCRLAPVGAAGGAGFPAVRRLVVSATCRRRHCVHFLRRVVLVPLLPAVRLVLRLGLLAPATHELPSRLAARKCCVDLPPPRRPTVLTVVPVGREHVFDPPPILLSKSERFLPGDCAIAVQAHEEHLTLQPFGRHASKMANTLELPRDVDLNAI